MNKDSHDSNHKYHDHSDHHAHMVADFKRRFWISLVKLMPSTALRITKDGRTSIDESMVTGESRQVEKTTGDEVITCPHALGLAVPLVVAVSTAMAAKKGLLIRDRNAFEKARNLDVVVFDKTGTLTQVNFGVSDIIGFGNISDDDILTLAAGLESRSEHSIAKGIVAAAGAVVMSLSTVIVAVNTKLLST